MLSQEFEKIINDKPIKKLSRKEVMILTEEQKKLYQKARAKDRIKQNIIVKKNNINSNNNTTTNTDLNITNSIIILLIIIKN
jgi:hypothetical protein